MKQTLAIWLCMIIIFISASITGNIISEDAAAQTITGNVTWQDMTIYLDEPLWIEGNLTLDNVTVVCNASLPGSVFIQVNATGQLITTNNTRFTWNNTNRYKIDVFGKLRMNNSKVEYGGGWTVNIKGNNSIIENSTFENNAEALALEASGHFISGCTFTGSDFALMINSNDSVFRNNGFINNENDLEFWGNNNSFNNNTMTGCTNKVVGGDPTNSTFRDNYISGAQMQGIDIRGSYNYIGYNNFSNNGYGGFSAAYSHNNTFSHNIIRDNDYFSFYGFSLTDAYDMKIHNNTLINNTGIGIYIRGNSSRNIVSHNVISDCAWGIYINPSETYQNARYNIIHNNSIKTCDYGIYSSSNSDIRVYSNNISNCTDAGIFTYQTNNWTIQDNRLYDNGFDVNDNGAVYMIHSNHMAIYNNTIYSNGSVSNIRGVYTSGEHNNISHNQITGYSVGIWCYAGKNRVENNTVDGGALGIVIWQSASPIPNVDNIIHNNEVRNTYVTGIDISNSNDNSVMGNIIANNTQDGMFLASSSGNTVKMNDIRNNRNQGIQINQYSDNNLLFSNNFIDNGGNATTGIYLQAYDRGTNNQWDSGYPEGGNYWSDYTGIDMYSGSGQDIQGSDGIGDTPYNVTDDILDNYPLQHPFNWWGEVSPSIELVTPANNSRIMKGTGIIFDIWDGNRDLDSVDYSLNSGTSSSFSVPYQIDTNGFLDGQYEIEVHAIDDESNSATKSYTFTIDGTAPTVIATIPIGDSTDVPVNITLSIEFSESMNNQSVNDAISISPVISISSYDWNDNNTILNLSLSTSFDEDTQYTVTIDRNATDLAGNEMDSIYSWSFTTLVDTDGDGIPDSEDEDDDNDGTPDTDDAFPLDETEDTDTDGDGIGNNADTDDDGDGWNDTIEVQAGTDPLNSIDEPVDEDGNGIPDNLEELKTGSGNIWLYILIILVLAGVVAVILFLRVTSKPGAPKEPVEESTEEPKTEAEPEIGDGEINRQNE